MPRLPANFGARLKSKKHGTASPLKSEASNTGTSGAFHGPSKQEVCQDFPEGLSVKAELSVAALQKEDPVVLVP